MEGEADRRHACFSGRRREGDWNCEACSNVNFAKRSRCNKCGVLKPKTIAVAEPTAATAALPSEGDWDCGSCGNVNWARRDRCNMCSSLKPVLQQEGRRLGRGGGHYDIQDPEDRLKHDSDHEDFDEFGRRKKRRRTTAPENKLILPTISTSAITEVKLVFPPAPISESDSDSSSFKRR